MDHASASLRFDGLMQPAYKADVPKSSGLQCVYVLPWTNGVKAVFTASGESAQITVSRYSAMGGGYAEDVAYSRNGLEVTWMLNDGDMGYIVNDNGVNQCYWITDYSKHRMQLNSVTVSEESDCAMTVLAVDGDAQRINYYSINGAPLILSRGIRIGYNTLEWDSSSKSYKLKSVYEDVDYVNTALHVTAPLADTRFIVSGDRFMEQWGEGVEVSTGEYRAITVAAETSANQLERDSDNEQTGGGSGGLGGSAPCEVEFEAYVSDAALFIEWQLSRTPDFEEIYRRYNDLALTYTFTEAGMWYVRFMTSDASGACVCYSDTYEVNIGESAFVCPNAFSPGVTEGVNDEWRVSYKSIVEFECHIFNRWGQQMAHFTDPSVGWDGKYSGKTVPAGVYYYVVKAKGADGRNYNLSGDINIVGYRERTNSNQQ
ncbi:MAG: gliding motility-associated C-terminal domain-containing protein [Muribaculaceae bacterium]|nr:gliding motility-associated C-terminal domain-containing protein [Muribaculaceae bacterium]